jgi:hypothetical protein
MVQQPLICDDYYVPDANSLITEDDTPVDNYCLCQTTTSLSWLSLQFLVGANFFGSRQCRHLPYRHRAQLLAEQLRALGVDQDSLT